MLLKDIKTLADFESYAEENPSEQCAAFEKKLIAAFEKTRTGSDDTQLVTREQMGQTPFSSGLLTVHLNYPVEFSNGSPLVTFKIKHGPNFRFITYRRTDDCTFRQLRDLVQVYLHISPENQRLILDGKLYKLGDGTGNEGFLNRSMGYVDGKVLVLLGATEKIIGKWSIASRNDRLMEPKRDRRLLALDRVEPLMIQRLHRIYEDRWLRRRPIPVVTGKQRLFGLSVTYPCEKSSDLAASLLATGYLPRFRCTHQTNDDLVLGLGCKDCTPRWLTEVVLVAFHWNNLRAQLLLFELTHKRIPRNVHDGYGGPQHTRLNSNLISAAPSLQRASENNNTMYNQWYGLTARFGGALREIKGFNEALHMDDCWNDEGLIRGATTNDVQEDAYAMELAAKVLSILVDLEQKYPHHFDVFDEDSAWEHFLLALRTAV